MSRDIVMVKGAYDKAGGPETLLQMIAAELDRERYRPLLALLARPGAELPPVLAEVAASLPSTRLPWTGLGSTAGAVRALDRLLRDRPGAVLHTNDMRADLLGFLLTRVRRVPWIAHVHGWLRHTHSGKHKVYEDIDRMLVRGADLVLVGSEAMAEEARIAGARRVGIVTNGVPLADPAAHAAEAAALRSGLPVGPGGTVLGLLGRLHPGKGHALLIRALAELRRKGHDACALLVGEGPAEAEYRALAAELGVAEAVVFAGLVPDKLPYLCAMDIVCVPSLKDSLPLTAMEAMSVTRPVVASRAGDLPLAFRDGENGLLVEVGSAEALEAAIARLIADPALAARLAAAGRQTLAARYSPAAMLRQLEGFCDTLLAEKEGMVRAAA
ncbi:glycosyltransferase family 4 protein [Roseomonas sp. OT10]|uniref:glycosyltransferase family 4 protein n=1 Tax=Roseomonas cutis TaxID=2897332 RepID=UPI001E481AC5|nr:glycosyltransferase family 4 protein [Roseomonas sp. OT10]UFN49756.1 glycosyltransferase family 4 protein [Roseomonas sp. OT10]